jgi:membrane protein YqaA with SNARE-associated domain
MPAFFMFEFEIGYWGLFISSFLAATIIPVTSEALLILMLSMGYDPLISLTSATIGNTLGGWLNYIIGRMGNPYWLKVFGATLERINKWKNKVNKYGSWMALFSWLPFIGDVLGIALGFFRARILPTFLFIFIGKFLRYLFLILFYNFL